MPVMDGLEATRQLRETGFRTSIIILTANATQEDRSKCFDAGTDAYLSKPINSQQFYHILSQQLTRNDHHSQSQNSQYTKIND